MQFHVNGFVSGFPDLGAFAGVEEGAHWVHGGTENVPVATLLEMYNVSCSLLRSCLHV